MEPRSVTIASSTLAENIKNDYKNALACGKSDEQAFAFASRNFRQINAEDVCTAHCALALAMHAYGRLTDNMKDIVLTMIDAGGDLSYYEQSGANEKTLEKRQKELLKVKEKLLSEMPAPKKATRPFLFRSPWRVGDLVAYPLENQYALMIVVSLRHLISPIPELSYDEVGVCFHDTLFDHLPTEADFHELRYMEIPSETSSDDKKQQRIDRYVRMINITTKSDAKRFFDACTLVGHRHDLYENAAQLQTIAYKQLDDTLNDIYESYQGKSEKHVNTAESIEQTTTAIKQKVRTGSKKVKDVTVKGTNKAKQVTSETSHKVAQFTVAKTKQVSRVVRDKVIKK